MNHGRETWGAVAADGVIDLGSKLFHATLQDFIASADFEKRDHIIAGLEIFDLVPGDVIATGTPADVGFTRKPPMLLVPGDLVEVEVEKTGSAA